MENLIDSEVIKKLNIKEEQQIKILRKLGGDEVKNYLSNFPISSVLLFGSITTDEFNEESDVDIAIIGEFKIDISRILRLELFLEDFLERTIDVVDLRSENLDIFIKINILNNGKTIYSKDNDKILNKLREETDWYYRENEHYFQCRRRDLLSWIKRDWLK